MAANSSEVTQLVDNIAAVTEADSTAIQEMSASAEEMNAQVQQVVSSTLSLDGLAK